MLSLINKMTAPPGGYSWEDEGSFQISGKKWNCWNTFLAAVHQRKLATGAFLGDGWVEEVEDQVCRRTGAPCVDKALPERHLNWSDLQQFFLVLQRAKDAGFELVSQEEAERRAAICAQCPKNQPLGGICAACAAFFGKFAALVSGRTTSKDGVIHSCSVCSCKISAAVHCPLEVQRDDRFTADQWPVHCWKRPA